MLTAQIDKRQLAKLKQAMGEKAKRLPKELAAAINKVAKQTQKSISKQVREEIAVPAKAVNKNINVRKASGSGNKSKIRATVTLRKTSRIPLRDFGARQNKSGVGYKISKKSGRQHIQGAFQGPTPKIRKASWKNRVFKRVGASRLPIVQLMGPSPWGVFAKRRLKRPTKVESKALLKKEIDRRIRFHILKRSGSI